MKLMALKNIPKMGTQACLCAESYLDETIYGKPNLELTDTHYFSKTVSDYLVAKRKELETKAFKEKLAEVERFGCKFFIHDAKAIVVLFIEKSNLATARHILATGLSTTSKLDEVRGKFDISRDCYRYELVVEMKDNERLHTDKIPSAGILRLITLIDLLSRNIKKVYL